jgi:hypothetical protein
MSRKLFKAFLEEQDGSVDSVPVPLFGTPLTPLLQVMHGQLLVLGKLPRPRVQRRKLVLGVCLLLLNGV